MNEFAVGMLAFVECPKCKHMFYTDKILPLLTLMLGKDVYSCGKCGNELDFFTISFCSRQLGEKCNSCKFRFICFATNRS